MRAVLLTGDQPNQRALANKLCAVCDLTGIVLSSNIPGRPPTIKARLRTFITGLEMRTFGRPLRNAWFEVQQDCAQRYPSFPRTSHTIRVGNVNAAATRELIAALAPDVVLVSGTNLVGKKLIAACGTVPVMNLHTGISPYVKGGPNCTNWCLAERLFHLIGSTVMWLDPGIDTGDIAATEATPLTFGETLGALHRGVMDHAHDLYVRSIRALGSQRPLARIPQSEIGQGRTFYTKDWNGLTIIRAQRNFARHYSSRLLADSAFQLQRTALRLVPLPS